MTSFFCSVLGFFQKKIAVDGFFWMTEKKFCTIMGGRHGREEQRMSIYDSLNTEQREAVFHTEGPLLILAGAGSGKTKVLTSRIAYLIENGVSPDNILAITFTNKAAKEMKDRVIKLIGMDAKSIQISTFHSLGLKLIKEKNLNKL